MLAFDYIHPSYFTNKWLYNALVVEPFFKLLDETIWDSISYVNAGVRCVKAVNAAALGTSDALLDVAPEIRNPALGILRQIARTSASVHHARPRRNAAREREGSPEA